MEPNELREGKAEGVWNMLLKEGWGRRRKKQGFSRISVTMLETPRALCVPACGRG